MRQPFYGFTETGGRIESRTKTDQTRQTCRFVRDSKNNCHKLKFPTLGMLRYVLVATSFLCIRVGPHHIGVVSDDAPAFTVRGIPEWNGVL